MDWSRARRDQIRTRSSEGAMAGNVRLPGRLARRTRFRREWDPPTECPPPSEDDILEDCEIALDIILRNVKGVKDLAEKIERRLSM